ncbi:hypothetical protein D3C86_1321920 [compost metagenome]
MRVRDWQDRFAAYTNSRAAMPFAWGSNDCCTFAAGAVEALTSVNPMAEVASYNSEIAAARLILRAGDLRTLASQFLGDPVPPLMAAVGDVVLLMNEGRELLGICNGVNALAPGPSGVVALEMTAATAAWKI